MGHKRPPSGRKNCNFPGVFPKKRIKRGGPYIKRRMAPPSKLSRRKKSKKEGGGFGKIKRGMCEAASHAEIFKGEGALHQKSPRQVPRHRPQKIPKLSGGKEKNTPPGGCSRNGGKNTPMTDVPLFKTLQFRPSFG